MSKQTTRGSTRIGAVLEEIAAAAGLDLTRVGATITVHNGAYAPLVLTVRGPNLVEAGHWGEDDETGKPLADPAVLYFTGQPELAWIPLESRNDYVDEHIVAATVAHGQVVVRDAGKLRTLLRFSSDWAERLRLQRYVKAAKEQGSRAAWTL